MPLYLHALSDTARIPARAHADDAGLDLYADIDLTLAPGRAALIPTGTAIALDPHTVGLVCPRSGLALNHSVTVLNAPGIIDAGYRGDVGVILINHGAVEFPIKRGDRIAQLLIVPCLRPTLHEVDSLPGTKRGKKGFGSTGR